ncbi:MAG: preprotein translocase subunit SecE [Kiritimatiellae bacterium]|nr:preprotein translocase subunit SecE [Kiritimatiellia bacterium]
METVNKTKEYLAGVAAEARKVTWPGKRELWESSLVVVAFIFILAVATGVCDRAIQFALGLVRG